MTKSSMSQRLSREKAVQRYLTALAEGDFSVIDAVWQQAENDPTLEDLLFNLHEAFPYEQNLLTWREPPLFNKALRLKKEQTMQKHIDLQGKEVGSFHAFPSAQSLSVRRWGRWSPLVHTLVAVLLVAFIVGGFLATRNWKNSHEENPKPAGTLAASATPRPTQTPISQLSPLCQVALPAAYQADTSLNDLLVLSQSNIWLVGSDSQGKVLALQWNGVQWSRTPVPTPAGSSLSKLAASSANDIWAIGETDYGSIAPPGGGSPSPSHTLIEHWNGTRWSQIASPDLLPSARNLLQGVTAIAPDNVWAVGAAGNDIAKSGYGPNTSPFVEHWDGAHWRLVTLPTIQSAGLNSVVALNANDVWAAGSSSTDSGNSQSPLVIHWDGQSWNQVETLTINGGTPGRLLKITADASHHLLALGFDQNGMPLLLSLSKGKWNALPVPPMTNATNADSSYNQFWDIAAHSSQDIWLAGESVHVPKSGASTFTPLVEHWDGQQWQSVPERYHGQASLRTISVSAGIIWSSGSIDYYGHPFLTTTCQ